MFVFNWLRPFMLVCLLQTVLVWCVAPAMSSGLPSLGPTIFFADAASASDTEPDSEQSAEHDTYVHPGANDVRAERSKPRVDDASSGKARKTRDRDGPGTRSSGPKKAPTNEDPDDDYSSYGNSRPSSIPAGRPDLAAPTCRSIQDEYDRVDFLTLDLRERYCAAKCSFLKYITCTTETSKPEFTAFTDAKDWFDNFDADNFFEKNEQPDIVTPEVIIIWWQLGMRAWAITLGVIPVLLNQSKVLRGRFWWSCAMIAGFGAIHFCGFCSLGIALNNCLLAWLSLVSPPGSAALPQYILMAIGTLVAAWSAFLTGPIIQIPITIAVLVGYGMYIKTAFFHRGKSSSFGGVAVILVQMIILSEQLYIAYYEFGLKSYTAMLLEYVIGSYLPCGGSKWYFLNSVYMSQRLAKVLNCAKFGVDPSIVAMNLVFLQIVMLLFSRACIGSYYLYSLRCRFEVEALWLGFWTYLIDIGGPQRTIYRQFFCLEERDPRKMLYGAAGTVMAASEYNFAQEFFYVRCIFTLINRLFIKSPYGKATHYLWMDIDCDGAYLHELFDHAKTHNLSSDGVYPHSTAGAWHDSGKLYELGQCVGNIIVTNKAGQKLRGVAMAVSSRTGTLLYSVLHVTANAASATFKGHQLQDPKFRTVAEGEDPVTSTICDVPCGPSLSLLTGPEIRKITTLICLNRTGGERGLDKKVAQAFVKDWSVDKHTGDLRVCANLREGDSGGPLIAVLSGGEFRLAGVVSRGSSAAPGNHVSLVVSKTDIYESDSESEHSFQRFNAVRRHTGHVSSEDAERMRYQAYNHLALWYKDNESRLNDFADWPIHFKFCHFPDYHDRADEIVSSLVKKTGDCDTKRGRGDDSADGKADVGAEPAPGKNNGNNRRKKSARKNRAAIKRAGLEASVLLERLLRIYCEEDAKVIFDFTMRGKLTALPKRGYVGNAQDGLVLFSDTLPDRSGYG